MKFTRYEVTSQYLEEVALRDYRPHMGIDYGIPEDTVLRSVGNGVVERVANFGNENLGQGVFIKLNNGETAIYGHMNSITVEVGDKLTTGSPIGLSGSTGHSSGPHLHFALKSPNGEFISPSKYDSAIQSLTGEEVGHTFAFGDMAQDIVSKLAEYHPPQFEALATSDFANAFSQVMENNSDTLINILGGG